MDEEVDEEVSSTSTNLRSLDGTITINMKPPRGHARLLALLEFLANVRLVDTTLQALLNAKRFLSYHGLHKLTNSCQRISAKVVQFQLAYADPGSMGCNLN